MGKFMFADIPGNRFCIQQELASGATNTAQELCYFVPDKDIKLLGAYLAVEAAMTGAATNYPSFYIKNRGTAGAGTTEMAVLDFSSTAVAIGSGDMGAFTNNATAASLLASSGEVISIGVAVDGTGKAYPKSHVTVWFEYQ